MKTFDFRGLMAPVFTPFNYDKCRSLNLDVIPEYANYLLNSGIKGVLVNGTSGEGMSMNVLERKAVTEKWVEVCKETKLTLMVQIGGAPLPDVLELAKHAEKNNVDALLCLPELYFKPETSLDLIKYLSTISNAAPNTPLLYYHIPVFTNVKINMPKFLAEANDKVKTLVGIKFTSCDLKEGSECVDVCGNKYTIFLGADQVMSGAYVLGFDSAIATTLNLYPEMGVNILKHMKNTENQRESIKLAREVQTKLTKHVIAITSMGSWVTSMKAAMNAIAPFKVGPTRLPLEFIPEDQILLI